MQIIIADQAIREEALDPTQSFIVQAPAGSGKTGLLTQRLLVLLSLVTRPEECLAITFTRKAAAEMRDRILSVLERAKEDPPEDFYERKTWALARKVLMRDQALAWNLLNNPNSLKIQTIDALCMSLTRQMPVISRFGSSPRVVEDATPLYQTAARELLRSLEKEESWSEPVRVLVAHLDNNLLLTERLLAEMLPHRDQWLPYIGRSSSEPMLRALLESGLRAIIQESLNALVKTIPEDFSEIVMLAAFAAEQLHGMEQESQISQCQDSSSNWKGADLNDLPIWKGFGELLLTKEGKLRKLVTGQQGFPAPNSATNKTDKTYFQTMKGHMLACLSRLENHPTFLENLERLCACPPATYSETAWAVVEALVKLLPVLAAELTLVFQQEGEVDFIEVSMAALRALRGEEGSDEPTDLALQLDYKIQHVLVDEFQDTSLSQFRLFELLTAGWQSGDGRTLFLVGDPMQSIYRFRQAEVGLFIRAKETGVGEVFLKSLTLTVNFRSDPKIVEWINQTFEKLFPKKDDIVSSAIAYSLSTSVRAKEVSAAAELREVTVESEAMDVVRLIESLKLEDPTGSIALLVRSRNHLQEILPALRQAGIDYQGVQLEGVSERTIIQDLLALTRALLHLNDRIAWLALLRAPWCDLSLEDLWVIATYETLGSDQEPVLPVWETLQIYKTIPTVSEHGKRSLEKCVPILSDALLKSGRIPLRVLILETWVALGGGDFLNDSTDIQNCELFFTILEEEHDYNFYESEVLERRLQSLYSKPKSVEPNALQVMTIHKAKGLEFDTVIVPGIGRKSYPDPARVLLWEERVGSLNENHLIFAPIKSVGDLQDPIYAFLKRQNTQKAKFEALRLWYVAATRARKRLYCFVHNLGDSLFSAVETLESF